MSETKRTNKSKEELTQEMKINQQKETLKSRMEALHKLEDELNCVFVPMIHRTETGSQTYISAFDKPEDTK